MSCPIPLEGLGAVGGVGAVTGPCGMKLQVVVQSVMGSGVCYLVYDPIQKKMFRPIKTGTSFWSVPELKIDTMYLFFPLQLPVPLTVSLPHSREDLHVQQWIEQPDKLNDYTIYNALYEIANNSVELIFGNIMEGKYVLEGTDCPSVGILRCIGVPIQLYYCFGKPRLKIGDSYDFPYKAYTHDQIIPGCPALIVLGLGRPYDGDGLFIPKRCYLLALRILMQPQLVL